MLQLLERVLRYNQVNFKKKPNLDIKGKGKNEKALFGYDSTNTTAGNDGKPQSS